VLRYVAILCLAGSYATALALSPQSRLYLTAAASGSLFLALAGAGWLAEMRRVRAGSLMTAAYYFVLGNLATGHALFDFVRGHRQVLWTPRRELACEPRPATAKRRLL
jgi:hypothetical protein